MASYTVRKGDTLWDLAQKNKTTVQQIAKSSGIKDPNKLAIGQRIVIPTTTSKPKPVVSAKPTATVSKPKPVVSTKPKTNLSQVVQNPQTTTSKPTPTQTTTPPIQAPPTYTLEDFQKIVTDSNAGLSTAFGEQIKGVGDSYTNQFKEFQGAYDEKFSALERMMTEQKAFYEKQYEDMMNRFRYVSSANAGADSANVNARDGVHLFDPGVQQQTQTQPVSVVPQTQNVAMNDSLFRYINNNLWGGGGF